MYILGLNAYHGGASACLIEDGRLVAAVEEERFTRVKYWAGFPVQAIQYCLAAAGITAYDLDHVALASDPSANLMQKVMFGLRHRPDFSFIRDRLQHMGRSHSFKDEFCARLGLDLAGMRRAKFHNVEHHRAHLAAAFLVSPFESAAVLSVDGMGDFVSTMWATGEGNTLDVHGEINFPHSLGYVYTALAQWLGFPKYGDEGKVMGLAPYGEPVYMDEMRDIVRIQRDGTFELNLDYFVVHTEGAGMSWDDGAPTLGALYSDRLVKLFGEPRRPRTEITGHHEDVAASLQAVLEEAEFAVVRKLQRETGQKVLCMAGGVALNSSFNGKVLPETGFEDIFVQPAAGDAGNALGAAYYVYNVILGQPRRFVMEHAYTGPEYGDAVIKAALDGAGLAYEELSGAELVQRAAAVVAAGDVLGWFQGRLEWGPRALGNRSIVADPRRTDMKDILNARIKHREAFRPFAPSVLNEYVGDYFDQTYPEPFMIKVYGVLPAKQAEVPAITHVDGTGRLQTVHREYSPLYWDLIDAFRQATGVPMVLNTSFNENEPIVCKPEEAIDCFARTRMDALGIGSFWVKK
ncbi:MAG: carbamoyltransferase [Anaerolineae bacterium]|nr:carbamoyltransferase [Anaerolineae bacterium]